MVADEFKTNYGYARQAITIRLSCLSCHLAAVVRPLLSVADQEIQQVAALPGLIFLFAVSTFGMLLLDKGWVAFVFILAKLADGLAIIFIDGHRIIYPRHPLTHTYAHRELLKNHLSE